MQRQQARFDQSMIHREVRRQAEKLGKFNYQLERWVDSCMVCCLRGAEEADYRLEECGE